MSNRAKIALAKIIAYAKASNVEIRQTELRGAVHGPGIGPAKTSRRSSMTHNGATLARVKTR